MTSVTTRHIHEYETTERIASEPFFLFLLSDLSASAHQWRVIIIKCLTTAVGREKDIISIYACPTTLSLYQSLREAATSRHAKKVLCPNAVCTSFGNGHQIWRIYREQMRCCVTYGPSVLLNLACNTGQFIKSTPWWHRLDDQPVYKTTQQQSANVRPRRRHRPARSLRYRSNLCPNMYFLL